MDYEAIVKAVASEQNMLRPGDELAVVGSLAMVDFVLLLEERSGLVIPVAALTPDAFRSTRSFAAVLERIASEA